MKYRRLNTYLFLIMVVVILCLVYNVQRESFTERENYDDYIIVCAKYDKPTEFLNTFEKPIKSVVLEKKKQVPNKANEASTYLYYIIENYDNLPENIIFIHDENESWHHTGKITDELYKWIDEYEKTGKTYYEFNNIEITKNDAYIANDAFKHFWNSIFKPYRGEYVDAKPDTGKCCAQFIVSKQNILKLPKDFYEKYYNWLIENTNGEGKGSIDDKYSGYNTGLYAEYTWRNLFT